MVKTITSGAVLCFPVTYAIEIICICCIHTVEIHYMPHLPNSIAGVVARQKSADSIEEEGFGCCTKFLATHFTYRNWLWQVTYPYPKLTQPEYIEVWHSTRDEKGGERKGKTHHRALSWFSWFSFISFASLIDKAVCLCCLLSTSRVYQQHLMNASPIQSKFRSFSNLF